MKKSNRRNFLTKGAAVTAAAAATVVPMAAQTEKPVKKVLWADGKAPEKAPLFSSTVTYGGLVFLSGVGAHFEGDIRAHTKHVLDTLEKQLEAAGSSMSKVLKCNVYLNDLKDYDGMNEMFRGRFGAEPPVRTTVAPAGGIPGKSLVEIDVIACV